MIDVENLCVKYLMNEMEPAERFSFEERLKADPNLIIEVEIMRKTLSQLKKLPEIKAPEFLITKIQALATSKSRKRRFISFATTGSMRYAAAAGALTLSFVIGWVINSNPTLKSGIQTNMVSPNTERQQAKGKWIDKKDVLHIDAYNVASTNKTDSVALKNAKKLRLIDKPLIDKPYSEELLLTRTRK